MSGSAELLPVRWRRRQAPLAPAAAAAFGPGAAALLRRASALPDERLAQLSGVVGEAVVVLLGPEAALPWVDGVVYLGRDPAAPAVLVPTTLEPLIPPALLERAVLGRVPQAPVAVLPSASLLVSTAAARPLDRDRLGAVLRAAEKR